MTTTDISKINIRQWDCLAQQATATSWFQTYEAYSFYSSLPHLFFPFVFAQLTDSTLNGVIVGYITKDPNPLKDFFSRRAIIIGGPLLSDKITNEELKELLNITRQTLADKAIYIETRNFNDYSKRKNVFRECGFKYEEHYNFHIDCSNLDLLESNLGKGRKRDIKTSLRDGATVIEHPDNQQIKDFYDILANLSKTKVKTPLFPFEFFEKLSQVRSAHFLLVEYKGEILGGTVLTGLQSRALYEWFVCGKDNAYSSIYPSQLATYSGMRYAAEHNYPLFDMMGAGVPDEPYGVRDFKARFGGKLVEHGRYLCINNKILYKIGTYAVKILKRL